MAIQLTQSDLEQLTRLLSMMPEYRTEQGRVDFIDEVFVGSSRRTDIVTTLNLGGTSRAAAVRTITRLTQFGQDEPGQETLGVLINKILQYLGGGDDADFLKGLFHTYALDGEPIASKGIDIWLAHESPQDVQEKIIGENTLRDIRVLELALEASESVVRIVTDESYGSGFLVAPNLIMTNNHVIGSQEAAKPCAYQFNYQLDKHANLKPVQSARTKPDGLFYTNPELDVTVVEVLDVPETVLNLILTPKRMMRDARVNIIQHPGGHFKKISMQNNFVAFANAKDLQYLTSTEPGSSGSPVFNNDFKVVGIHHSGGNLLEPESSRRYLRNAGSSMVAVLGDLQQNAPEIYAQLQIE